MPNRVRVAATTFILASLSIAIGSAPAHADTYRNKEWHLANLRVADAHEITKVSGITVAVVDTGVEPLWEPLRRAWAARLRPPPRPGPSIGQAELSIVPAGKERMEGSVEEVWLDDRRILYKNSSARALA